MKKLLFKIPVKKILFLCLLQVLFSNFPTLCDNVGDADYDWAITVKNGYFYPQDCTLRKIFCQCGNKGGYWFEGAVRYNIWKRLDIEASGSYFGKTGKALCSNACTNTCANTCTNTNYGTCSNTCSNICTSTCANACANTCTEVKIPTLGLGLKYFLHSIDCDDDSSFCDRISFFVGAGLRTFFYRENNKSPYVIQCVKKNTVGGMVNFGLEFTTKRNFFIDLFLDYNFKKLKPCCKNSCNSCNQNNSCNLNNSCNSCNSGNQCNYSCNPSCFYNINLGGLVTGIGLGYKF